MARRDIAIIGSRLSAPPSSPSHPWGVSLSLSWWPVSPSGPVDVCVAPGDRANESARHGPRVARVDPSIGSLFLWFDATGIALAGDMHRRLRRPWRPGRPSIPFNPVPDQSPHRRSYHTAR